MTSPAFQFEVSDLAKLLSAPPAAPPKNFPCPFPEIGADGGRLLRWGIASYGPWAEYSVPLAFLNCVLCGEAIGPSHTARGVAVLPDGAIEWCHVLCRQKANAGRIAMGTHSFIKNLPDCSMCGQPYTEGHFRPVTSIWDAYCDTEGLPEVQQFYRPSKPFPSPDWPHDLITDSPRYAGVAAP